MTDEIRRIPGLPDGLKPALQPGAKLPAGAPSFSGTLGSIVREVDHLQKVAGNATQRMVSGEIEDIHQVMVAVEEAQTSFRLLMEIRNKMVEAYKDIMKMQV